MTQSQPQDYSHSLQPLMQRVGIASFRALSRKAEVSYWQVTQLRQGRASQMRLVTLLKLAQALQISLIDLLALFPETNQVEQQPTDLKHEYDRLATQLADQKTALQQEFQQQALQVLESWLLQWPTAAYAAQQNPQVPAVKLLPLVRPIEQLVQHWGVEAIAAVGTELPFDPHLHQLIEGSARPGEAVRVRYAGYRQGDKLLFRAKVSPITQ